jgi:hypothetical protein
MNVYHELHNILMNMSPKRVSETAPVQVYLDRQSRERLDQLAGSLDITKSEVLRRGLLALERETSDPSSHPVLRLVGAVAAESRGLKYDVAREHDRFLATVSEPAPGPAAKTKGRPRA